VHTVLLLAVGALQVEDHCVRVAIFERGDACDGGRWCAPEMHTQDSSV
jgi:hypothetical protein